MIKAELLMECLKTEKEFGQMLAELKGTAEPEELRQMLKELALGKRILISGYPIKYALSPEERKRHERKQGQDDFSRLLQNPCIIKV